MKSALFRNQAAWLGALALTFAAALDSHAQQRTGGTAIRPSTTQRTGTTGGATGSRAGGGTRQYLNNTMVGDAMISVDPETRQLIIVTDENTNLQIKEVIDNLDRPKPQVLIKVVFVQVTHNDDLDFGVEGQYTRTSQNGNVNSGGTDLGLAAAQALAGGGFYSFVGQDVELLVRALQVIGKTEVLSRPSILARNNQQATIIVGQEVPFITNSRFDQNGNQINTIQYQDVGIILRVTPFITSDGLVEMIVTPEISALNRSQTVQVQEGVEQPVIDKRSADTVVVTPSGRTVVIGGLIEKQKTDRVRKVPVLGDIPLIGYAFKRTIKVDQRTELLIFLTPNVVQKPGDLANLAIEESRRMELAPKAFKQKELEEYLEGLPTKQTEPAKPADEKSKSTSMTKPDTKK
jgi:general secretion pathway protein D